MKAFFVLAIIAAVATIVVAAVVFRSRAARDILFFVRRIAFGYVIAMILLAVFYAWRDGF